MKINYKKLWSRTKFLLPIDPEEFQALSDEVRTRFGYPEGDYVTHILMSVIHHMDVDQPVTTLQKLHYGVRKRMANHVSYAKVEQLKAQYQQAEAQKKALEAEGLKIVNTEESTLKEDSLVLTMEPNSKEFKQLQSEWYAKLKDMDFQDIEDHSKPEPTLKAWDSFRFVSEEAQARKTAQEAYQEVAESLIVHPDFMLICQSIVKHGHSSVTAELAGQVWEFHVEGLTEREIALKLSLNRRSIQRVIGKWQQWMKLL